MSLNFSLGRHAIVPSAPPQLGKESPLLQDVARLDSSLDCIDCPRPRSLERQDVEVNRSTIFWPDTRHRSARRAFLRLHDCPMRLLPAKHGGVLEPGGVAQPKALVGPLNSARALSFWRLAGGGGTCSLAPRRPNFPSEDPKVKDLPATPRFLFLSQLNSFRIAAASSLWAKFLCVKLESVYALKSHLRKSKKLVITSPASSLLVLPCLHPACSDVLMF